MIGPTFPSLPFLGGRFSRPKPRFDRVSQVPRVLPLVLQSQLLHQHDTGLHHDLLRHAGRRGPAENLLGQKSGKRSRRKSESLSFSARNLIGVSVAPLR